MSAQFGSESGEGLAPVIPLFGDRAVPVADTPSWRSTWAESDDDEDEAAYEGEYDACGAIEREIAERNLLKRLRTRQLSVAEARAVVAERDLGPGEVETVLADFQRLGYLDDAALAEQLIHVGADRKGQGRQVIAQTLAQRRIPRDVAQAALSALPDDEAERALEFARERASRMTDLDDTVALRRLLGQLARRGYGGSIATSAARTALAERGGGSSSVRFR